MTVTPTLPALTASLLALVALILLFVALGWRQLALGYQRQLHRRRSVWVLECRPPCPQLGFVVGGFATRELAEGARARHLASGRAASPAAAYQVAEYPVYQASG